MLGKKGLTIVECLVALVLFSIGVLGAVGTIGLAVRLAERGNVASAAADWSRSTLDSLRSSMSRTAGNCSALSPGSISGPGGLTATWSLTPARGGLLARLSVRYPVPGARRLDSLTGFVQCR